MALIISALMLWFLQQAKAVDPTVAATLSSDSTEVGQPVELNIQINGSQRAQVPDKIDVEGLTVIHTGQQTQVQMQNFTITSSVMHTYTVQPDHAGKFTIPAITIEVDGKKLTTQPLALTVAGNSGGAGSSGGSSSNSGASSPNGQNPEVANKIAFSEIVLPKQTAYVGETIPIEIRVYFDASVRVQMNSVPTVKCEGFTIQNLTQPHQEQIEKNGRRYNFVSFKTAITPVKSGKLTLGPATLPYVAMVPQHRRASRPNGGNMDSFFDDDLFNGMLGGYTQEELTVKSNETDLEIKPLPATGQPGNFSGAVGLFSMATEASPLKLNTGDPITLKLKISGRGNFDMISAPHIVEEIGWRSYPPSSKFTADDDVGISGSKTFEMALIPEEKKAKLPVVEFSYFDPIAEKYVTLNADRLPIAVEGQGTPAPVAQASPASQPVSTPIAAKSVNDINYLLTGPAHWGESFDPIFTEPVFWKSQGVPFLAFLAFIGFQVNRRKGKDAVARRLAEARRQKSELMKILQREDTDPATFYSAATRYLQVEAASRSNRNPASIASAEIITMRPLDATTGNALQSIFATHEELHYAGEAVTRQKTPPAQRESVLDALKKFENARD